MTGLDILFTERVGIISWIYVLKHSYFD